LRSDKTISVWIAAGVSRINFGVDGPWNAAVTLRAMALLQEWWIRKANLFDERCYFFGV